MPGERLQAPWSLWLGIHVVHVCSFFHLVFSMIDWTGLATYPYIWCTYKFFDIILLLKYKLIYKFTIIVSVQNLDKFWTLFLVFSSFFHFFHPYFFLSGFFRFFPRFFPPVEKTCQPWYSKYQTEWNKEVSSHLSYSLCI